MTYRVILAYCCKKIDGCRYYQQWGRLLYNPQVPDALFEEAFEGRYPGQGARLFEAQRLVGRVPLIVASYWDVTWD